MPTKIEWAKNLDGTPGETWNPVTGCTPVSEGCENCYARRLAKRFPQIHDPERQLRRFSAIHTHKDTLDIPLRWRKPRRVFVCSMGDLFHENVPDKFIAAMFGVMAACPHHTFMVLTKRPARMGRWFSWIEKEGAATARFNCEAPSALWTLHAAMMCARQYEAAARGAVVNWPPPNVWLGVTVENQRTACERIPPLLQTPAAVRFVSCEPLLGLVDLSGPALGPLGLDWVIVGAETGPGARPMNPDWARSIRDQCKEAGMSFFMKKLSKNAPIPDDLMIREFPEQEGER